MSERAKKILELAMNKRVISTGNFEAGTSSKNSIKSNDNGKSMKIQDKMVPLSRNTTIETMISNDDFCMEQWPQKLTSSTHSEFAKEFVLEKFYDPVVTNELKSSVQGFDFNLKNLFKDCDDNEPLFEDSDDSVKDPDFCETSSSSSEVEVTRQSSSDSGREITGEDAELELLGRQIENELLAESGKNLKSIRQKCRNSGQSYNTSSGKIVKKRVLQEFDKCRNNCRSKVEYETCKKLFHHYWSLGSYELRILYIGNLLEVKGKKCDTLTNSDARKRMRSNTIEYSLHFDGNVIKVCRKHFTQCFDETESFIKSVIRKKITCPSIPFKSHRGKSTPVNKLNSAKIDEVKTHINKFPAYDSHYSRRHTSKKYLHSALNLATMHKMYTTETENPVSLSKYSEVFRSMDLKFKAPKLDTCFTCDTLHLKIKNAKTEKEKVNLEGLKKQHVDKADNGYEQKRVDKDAAKKNQNIKAFAFDLQQCLPTPFLRTSVTFYKRQLWTFNLTVHDLEDDETQCFMWHEAAARRGGNEIASCVYKQLNMIDKQVTQICFYSDSCVGQNKNSYVAAMFMTFVHNNHHMEFIDHKFLEPGHTHMECDSDHALIERKKKNTSVEIQVPRDWYQFVSSVRSKMHVVEMRVNDFLNFSELSKSKFIWRRYNETGEKFVWNEVRWLRYTKGLTTIFYKTSLDPKEPFKVLKIGKRGISSINPSDISVVRDVPVISHEKKKDLLDMKGLIDPIFHSFYENLNESVDEPNIHPDLVDEEEEDNV